MRLYSIMYSQKDESTRTERFKITHISDAHISSNSGSNHTKKPNNLLEAVSFSNQQELAINAIVATGDHINYEKKRYAQESLNSFFQNLFNNNTIPTFPCYGNHDANITDKQTSELINKNELYFAFNNHNNHTLHRESGENYYYADVTNPMGGHIRIIALDMLDHAGLEYNSLHDAFFSQKQIDWLCKKALKEDMTENHNVIIITHFPFEAYSQKNSSFLIDGQFVHSSRMVPEIIEAFRDKRPIKEKFPNHKKSGDSISVSTDFSSYKGDFICYMGGHAHVTTQFEVTNIKNKSVYFPPQKMLLCTNMSPSETGVIFNRVKRKTGTVSDNSFCIYSIDTMERNIYITFFGAYLPSDKTEEEYPETQVIGY